VTFVAVLKPFACTFAPEAQKRFTYTLKHSKHYTLPMQLSEAWYTKH